MVVNGVSVVAEQYCFCFSLSRKQSCVVCVAEFDVTVIDLVVAVAGEFAESDALQNTVVKKSKDRSMLEQLLHK